MGKDPIILKNKKINKKKKKQTNKQKPASTPEQDLHPDWDRCRATMLYPMSCGEILSLLVTSGAHTARKTCTQSIRKNDLGIWPKYDIFSKSLVVLLNYVIIWQRSDVCFSYFKV